MITLAIVFFAGIVVGIAAIMGFLQFVSYKTRIYDDD